MVEKALTETDVFNDLRALLSNTELQVLQLVPPGGQAPLSLTYTPTGAERPKTVYPDLIAYDDTSIYLGELKPRFSKADVEKLMSIQSSEDALDRICRMVKNKGKTPPPKYPNVVFLLVHTQEDAPQVEGIVQVVFLRKDGTVLLGDKKAPFYRVSSSLDSIIRSVS